MLNPTAKHERHQHLKALPPHQQRQVLEFARALATVQVQGVPGQELLSFAGAINAEDLAVMSQAAQDCGGLIHR